MKTKQYLLAVLLVVPLLAVLMGCRNPMALLKSTDGVTGSTAVGVVSLKIWPVAPMVVDLLAKSSLSRLRSVVPTKAFLAATRVHVRLSGPKGVVQWDEYLDPGVLCFDQGGLVGVVPQVTTRSVPTGSYSATVDIYNTVSNPYNPVSTGSTAEVFSVAANESTNVTVSCLPNNATLLEKGVTSDPFELAVAWQTISTDPLEIVPGSEQWVAVTLTSGTSAQVTVAPTPGSEWTGGVFVFDPYGAPVMGGGSGGEDPAAYITFDAAYTGTYYVGVLGGTGPFTVLVDDAPPPPAPVADFAALAVGGGTPSGDAPLNIQFNDTSEGMIDSWAWDFQNDGTIDSTEQNPTFLYEEPTRYSVELTVSGPGGSDTVVKQGLVAVYLPEASYLVDANGGDDSNPGSRALPFKTITKAVATAGEDTTIQVFPGTYDVAHGESYPISLKSGQTLVGDVANRGNGPTPTLLLGHGPAPVGIFGYSTIVAADMSRLTGLMFDDTTRTTGTFAITAVNAQTTVESNSFDSNLYGGVYLDASGISTIERNSFRTSSYGTYLYFTTSAILIDGNEFLSSSLPIDMIVTEGDSPAVTNNTFTASGMLAVQVQQGAPLISGNTFQNPGGYLYGAVYCLNDGAVPILRGNEFVCGIAVGIRDDRAANPDCGTSRDPGNNDFSGVTGSAINMGPGTTANILAYGNTWAHDPPTTGTSGSYDIVVQGTGSVTWDLGQTFPLVPN